MLRKMAARMLGHYGVEIVRAEEAHRETTPPAVVNGAVSASFLAGHLGALASNPLDPNLHARYAEAAAAVGLRYLAYAEAKTAEYLSGSSTDFESLKVRCAAMLPELAAMNHNQHYRLASLASEIKSRANGDVISVLDVGGSDGRLAAFISQHLYCLAEPSLNAISGSQLPFADGSFDFVVSCHVLEHIPVEARTTFLDQLLSKARRGVILLNPFHADGAREIEQLIFATTGADWAKEHLDCTLPTLENMSAYAAARGLRHSVRPNGSIMTTLPFVFVDYFASRAGGCADEMAQLNRFFNEKFATVLDSVDHPTAYIVYLGR
jgi:hypothetical protein